MKMRIHGCFIEIALPSRTNSPVGRIESRAQIAIARQRAVPMVESFLPARLWRDERADDLLSSQRPRTSHVDRPCHRQAGRSPTCLNFRVSYSEVL